jgi:hypothetical protein
MNGHESSGNGEKTPVEAIRTLLKSLHPDRIGSNEVEPEARALSQVLTSILSSPVFKEQKVLPERFDSDFQGKDVRFIGRMTNGSDKLIRAARPYKLESPADFIVDLEKFLQTGELPPEAESVQVRMNKIYAALISGFNMQARMTDRNYTEERLAMFQALIDGFEAAHVQIGGVRKELYGGIQVVMTGSLFQVIDSKNRNLLTLDGSCTAQSVKEDVLTLWRNNAENAALEKEVARRIQLILTKYGAHVAQPLMPRATMARRNEFLKLVQNGLEDAQKNRYGDIMKNERIVDTSTLPLGAIREAFFDGKDLTLYVLRDINDPRAIADVLKAEHHRQMAINKKK